MDINISIYLGLKVLPKTYIIFIVKVLNIFLKKYLIHLFLERGEGRDKERERNVDV